MRKQFFVFVIILFSCMFSFNVDADDKIIKMGTITSGPKEEVETYRPFVKYLASQLADHGIESGKVVVPVSMDEMVSLLRKGEIDIYVDSPFPVLSVKQNADIDVILRRWKKGVKEYNSVIFVRKDSGVSSIEDLYGKMIAFEEPFSTSSCLLAKATLMQKGIVLQEKARFMDFVPEDKLGFVYSYDDETTMLWVLRKKVVAGALSMKNFNELSKDKKDELKIILETINVPRQVVAVRKNLDPNIKQAIKEVFLKVHLSVEGKELLNGFESTKMFDEIPNGYNEYFAPIMDLFEFIK